MRHLLVGDEVIELLLFKCGELSCGVDIRQVQEISKDLAITQVWHAPSYVRGVLNLRGQLLTVLDLRKRFDMAEADIALEARVVVVKDEEGITGLLVDQVVDIVEARSSDMEPPPSHIDEVPGSLFRAIYKREKELVAVLDLEQVLAILE